jgi:hypothetical protein
MRLAGPMEPVIAGLLKRDPAERTGPELLARQLQRVLAGQTPLASTSGRPAALGKPARGMRAVLVGVGVVAVLVTVGVAFSSEIRRNGLQYPGMPFTDAPEGKAVPSVGIPGCEMPRGQISPPPPGQMVGGPGLPDGWMLHWDPLGFTAAVPADWAYWRLAENTVCFREPGGSRVLGVMPLKPKPESLPEYREISTKQIHSNGQALEWEFTYMWGERQRHAIAVVTSAHTLFWIADDTDFAASRPLYDVARTWFSGQRPVSGPTG